MRMNKLAAVLCAAAMMGTNVPAMAVTTPMTVCAEVITSGTCGADLTWKFSVEDGTLTISGTGPMEEYSGTDAPWYDWLGNVKKIVVQDGVTSIGNLTFVYYYELTEISLPDTLVELGYGAFAQCNQLTTVKLPASLERIGSRLYIPDAIDTFLPSSPFIGCAALTDVEVDADNPNFVSVDGILYSKDMKTLFCYPSGKDEDSYTVPDGVTTISSSAISSNSFLEQLTFPEGLEMLDINAVESLDHIKTVSIPASVTMLDNNFAGCTHLSAIEVAKDNTVYTSVDGVLYSKDMTVLYNYPAGKSGKSYEIPDGVTTIFDTACEGTKLVTVTVPASVTTVRYGAFKNCNKLKDITFLNPNCEVELFSSTIYNGWSNELGAFSYSGTIHGYEGSTVQKYAEECGYKFEAISETAPTDPPAAAVMGDLDGSGAVDIMDVIKINKSVLGTDKLAEEQQKLADINKDGKVDSADALLLLKLALGMQIE